MREYRVLVASQGHAELYALAAAAAPLRQLAALDNPAGRQRSRDLGTGKPGRVMNRTGGVRHALEQAHGLREEADRKFARDVAATLTDVAGDPRRVGLVLVAAPRLLALYRQLLPRAVAGQVVATVPANLAKAPTEVLRRRVRTALRGAGLGLAAGR